MIHVLFSSSAAGTLRALLRTRGSEDRVVDLVDTLDWGPISTGSCEDRADWLNRHVPNGPWGWDWIADDVDEFRKSVANDPERLIWIAPRSAAEQCGLYWYLTQFGGADARMIVADYPLDGWRGEAPDGLGVLSEEAIAELLDGCPHLPVDPVRFPADRWKTLVDENALIRIMDGGALRSAPDDFFDELLLARCPSEWTNWPRVIGYTMADSLDFGYHPCDRLLLWRLRELVQREQIVCYGELPLYGDTAERKVHVRRAL